MKFWILLLGVMSLTINLQAQDDLLDLLGDDDAEENIEIAAFKTTRVVNGQSIENLAGGVLDVKIQHRFGFINSGAYDLFGLDNSTVRLGMDYGITDKLMVGFGRSSFEKTFDGFVKYRVMRQQTGKRNIPLSISAMSSIAVTTLDWQDPERENYFSSRLFYTHQLLLARKFSDNFTWQFMPTLVHRNLVSTADQNNDVVSIGTAFRQKISNRVTINVEYFYVLPDQIADEYKNSLSVGFDIETGGHVFQLHFTNSTSMVHKGFIAETVGEWMDGDIHFGFNIARVFTVKKPKFD